MPSIIKTQQNWGKLSLVGLILATRNAFTCKSNNVAIENALPFCFLNMVYAFSVSVAFENEFSYVVSKGLRVLSCWKMLGMVFYLVDSRAPTGNGK